METEEQRVSHLAPLSQALSLYSHNIYWVTEKEEPVKRKLSHGYEETWGQHCKKAKTTNSIVEERR